MIEDLIYALNRLNRATKAYEKTRDACDSYGGYYLHSESEEVEEAKIAFENNLNAIIDARIYKKLFEYERGGCG